VVLRPPWNQKHPLINNLHLHIRICNQARVIHNVSSEYENQCRTVTSLLASRQLLKTSTVRQWRRNKFGWVCKLALPSQRFKGHGNRPWRPDSIFTQRLQSIISLNGENAVQRVVNSATDKLVKSRRRKHCTCYAVHLHIAHMLRCVFNKLLLVHMTYIAFAVVWGGFMIMHAF
jgi:hypothetical protein